MKETWGFVWFAAALCIIMIVAMFLGSPEAGLPAFFSFLPIVFFLVARTIKNLTERVSHLERALRDIGTQSSG